MSIAKDTTTTTIMDTTTTTREVTLNVGQQIYVIPVAGGGFSCWGFQNCWDEVREMLKLLPKPESNRLTPEELEFDKVNWFGTMNLYRLALRLRKEYAESPLSEKTWFDPNTPSPVRKALEHCRGRKLPVRIWLGDQKTGRSWLEEHDVCGHIGRSTGPMKVPLLVPEGEDGGGAILTNHVVRIDCTGTGKTLWKHKNFHLPLMTIKYRPASKDAVVRVDGDDWSRHDDLGSAAAFVAWLHGSTYKPEQ